MEIDYGRGTAHFSYDELLIDDNIKALNAFYDATNTPRHYTLKDGIIYLKEGVYPIQRIEIRNNQLLDHSW